MRAKIQIFLVVIRILPQRNIILKGGTTKFLIIIK